MAASLASIALGLLLAGQAATTNTATTTTAPAGDVAALVARLAADDTAERDAAQQAILDFPGDPTDALRAARPKTTDPDVRMRIDALLVQGRERFELGASRVTLAFADAPLDRVVEALGKQSRTRFNDLGPEFGTEMPRVTVDLRDATFWEAVARVQQAGNVVFQPGGGFDGGWRVSRNFGQGNGLRGVEAGAFFVQPVIAHYSRSVAYARNVAGNESFSVQMTMLAEPKIRLSEQGATVVLERARDNRGNDLVPPSGRGQSMNGGFGQNQVNFQVQLAYPKEPGDTITELAGVVRFAIANRLASVESEDLLGGGKIERQIEGVRVTITAAMGANRAGGGGGGGGGPDASRLELVVSIDRNAGGGGSGDAGLADRVQRSLLRARITDPAGRLMQPAGINNTRSGDGGSEFRASFQPTRAGNAPGEAAAPANGTYKMRVEVPIGFRPVELPFVLRDLKMP